MVKMFWTVLLLHLSSVVVSVTHLKMVKREGLDSSLINKALSYNFTMMVDRCCLWVPVKLQCSFSQQQITTVKAEITGYCQYILCILLVIYL